MKNSYLKNRCRFWLGVNKQHNRAAYDGGDKGKKAPGVHVHAIKR